VTLPPAPVFAITGATGAVGGRVCRRLADAGAEQVLVGRNPAKAPQLPHSTVRTADFDDPVALRRAFAGTSTVFLVSASEHPDRVRLHRQAIDAAVAAGVTRIVYLSFLGAAPDATFTFARDHYATEEHLRSSGLAATSLRDSMYMDFLPYFADSGGVLRGPAGDGAVSAVARDDVADVATRVLLEPQIHDGLTYDLTGPAALTLHEVAAALAEVSGRSVRYLEETEEEAYASRAGAGADFEIAGWVSSYQAIAAGELALVSDAVARITGAAPMAFRDFLRRDPGSWQHLKG
jgi:NAD(P)H dehydrogenase (quinone)